MFLIICFPSETLQNYIKKMRPSHVLEMQYYIQNTVFPKAIQFLKNYTSALKY